MGDRVNDKTVAHQLVTLARSLQHACQPWHMLMYVKMLNLSLSFKSIS